MSVRREGNGTWTSQFWFRDYDGNRRHKTKRGFATEEAALEWEEKGRLEAEGSVSSTFAVFFEVYKKDMKPRLRESTWIGKEYMVRARPADEDVLLDALVEEEHVLLDYGEEARHLPFGEAGQVSSTHSDVSAVRMPESHDQTRERALPAPRGAHERVGASLAEHEVDRIEGTLPLAAVLLALRVGERDPVQLDISHARFLRVLDGVCGLNAQHRFDARHRLVEHETVVLQSRRFGH